MGDQNKECTSCVSNYSSNDEGSSDDDLMNKKEEYDYDKIEEVGILSGTYKLDDMEEELFEGHYKSKFIKNKVLGVLNLDEAEWNIGGQIIYKKGRVLYKSDIEENDINIFDLIDLFILYTYDPCSDLDLDKSINETTQMMGGTICPTRKRLFIYKNREFTAYGRYIFGQDGPFVKIKTDTSKIKLHNPPYDGNCDEYVYSFMIKNNITNVVEAFGLYR